MYGILETLSKNFLQVPYSRNSMPPLVSYSLMFVRGTGRYLLAFGQVTICIMR